MPITFRAQVTEKDWYHFSLRHAYTSFSGLSTIFFAALIFIIAATTRERIGTENVMLYCVLAVLFLVYNPIFLWVRAKAILKVDSPMTRGITYTLQEDGMSIQTDVANENGEQEAFMPYKQVYKVILTSKTLLVYTNRVNAFIIPRRDIVEQESAIKELLRTKLDGYKINF